MPSPLTQSLSALLLESIRQECATDHLGDDVTSRLLGTRAQEMAEARVLTREAGCFCGEAVVAAFQQIFPGLRFQCFKSDGDVLTPGETLVELRGSVGTCLGLERTLVNYLSHLCGVATLTRQYVQAVKGRPTRILATRKTLPGLRALQLQAVQAGGGTVHRRSLSDGILLKDNHLAFLGEAEAVRAARAWRSPLHRIEVEVQSLEQLTRVLENPPDVVMLDNLSFEEMALALKKIGKRCEVEVSGGVRLEQIQAIAELGVDYISVGRLTHSASALNLTMDILPEK